MPAQPIKLGPFYGGINTLSDPSGLEDNELVDCVNLELDLNGSLITRPPIKIMTGVPASTSRMRVIGTAIIGVSFFIIVANDTTVWAYNGATFTQLATGLFASKALQYRSFVYIVCFPSSAGNGGRWDGGTYSTIATLPKGTDAIIFKERMYIASGDQSNRLKFSDISDPTSWPSVNFFDVSPGDGQSMWHLAIFNNNLLIFRSDSTYVLTYDTKPADATLDKISNAIGTTSYGCLAQNQNNIFVYHEGDIFQLVNYEFVQVNPRVIFEYDGFAPTTRADTVVLSFVGNRLVVRFFNRLYIYNILTQTWTRWESADLDINNVSAFVEFPNDPTSNVDRVYYAGSSLAANGKMFTMKNAHTILDAESVPISCRIVTKDYTADTPWKFKRLYFWGVDAMTSRDIVGIATPIVFGYSPNWGDIQTLTWDSLNTWAQPTKASIEAKTTVLGGAGILKRFFKFNKALRFRQINFEVDMQTDGTKTEGPTRFYSLTLFLNVKETVSKQVS